MIYPSTYEEKLGFDRIREMLSDLCLCPLGRKALEGVQFLSDHSHVVHELSLASEMQQIIQFEEHFPTENYIDCTPALEKLQKPGTFPEVDELNKLRKSLTTLRLLSAYFSGERIREKYTVVTTQFRHLEVFPDVTDSIDRIMDNHGVIRDQASPQLRDIRQSYKKKQSEVSRKMQSILRKAQQDGLVDKDTEVTIRNGRPVIPVSSGNKRKLGGLVHDESASGKTSFIEPQIVVELNNELRELEYAERREIVRILVEFADETRPSLPGMLQSYEQLGMIDLYQAKARLSLKIGAVKPIVNKKQEFNWREARHPLLFLHLQRENREVVPLDIQLGNENRILIISGPNAGGKSVCLKTVGLLQYMLQCGLPVPMLENSEACLFERIFLDIGDEQSLDNDLSTYSSHLQHMKFFLKHANEQSLILIDEFGTGTEPALGGSIAEAVLSSLNSTGVFGVITTHYANLKHFASENKGVVNGAMLFDTQKIQPVYKLSVGEPGSSFAIDIARNIGLPEEILERAQQIVGEDYVNFDRHLREISRDKKYWQDKRNRIRTVEKNLDGIYERYQSELEDLQQERKELLRKAREEASEILNGANKTIEKTIREIRESHAEKERTKQARENLNAQKEQLKSSEQEDAILRKKQRELEQSRERLFRHNPDMRPRSKKSRERSEAATEEKIEIGDKVRMKGLETSGEVVEINGGQYIVAFGTMLTTLSIDKIEKTGSRKALKKAGKAVVKTNFSDRKMSFRPEIDIRGKRADEALQIVQDFLDDAIMNNARHLQILHGKGNGVLRQLIRDYLKSTGDVVNMQDAHADRGGAGITLVELR